MAKPTNTNNANTMPRLDIMPDQRREHSHASTHERCSLSARDGIGDLVQVRVRPDGERRKRALVQVLRGVLSRRNLAVEVVVSLAGVAFAAAVAQIAKAYA